MYKYVFRNSKVALLFAGMTLFSAVSMIGTPEDKGALTEAVDLVEAVGKRLNVTHRPVRKGMARRERRLCKIRCSANSTAPPPPLPT